MPDSSRHRFSFRPFPLYRCRLMCVLLRLWRSCRGRLWDWSPLLPPMSAFALFGLNRQVIALCSVYFFECLPVLRNVSPAHLLCILRMLFQGRRLLHRSLSAKSSFVRSTPEAWNCPTRIPHLPLKGLCPLQTPHRLCSK